MKAFTISTRHSPAQAGTTAGVAQAAQQAGSRGVGGPDDEANLATLLETLSAGWKPRRTYAPLPPRSPWAIRGATLPPAPPRTPTALLRSWAAKHGSHRASLPPIAELPEAEPPLQNSATPVTRAVKAAQPVWTQADMRVFHTHVLNRICRKADDVQRSLIMKTLFSLPQATEKQIVPLLSLAMCDPKTDPQWKAFMCQLYEAVSDLPEFTQDSINKAIEEWLDAKGA